MKICPVVRQPELFVVLVPPVNPLELWYPLKGEPLREVVVRLLRRSEGTPWILVIVHQPPGLPGLQPLLLLLWPWPRHPLLSLFRHLRSLVGALQAGAHQGHLLHRGRIQNLEEREGN